MEEKPRYKHECPNCVFLGQYATDDLYYCPQGGMPTFIARDGSIGHEYRTMPLWCWPALLELEKRQDECREFRDYVMTFKEARRRAVIKELVEDEVPA